LSLAGNTLSLTNDGTSVDLSGYLDNTDNQTIDVFSLTGTTLNLSLESDGEATQTVDLSSLQDGTGTDDQTATEVSNTAVGNLTSTNVQAALEELQGDIDGLSGGGMTSFNIQEDGGATEAISDGETVNFVSGTNMSITRSTNTLTFNNTYNFGVQSGGGAVTDISDDENINFVAGSGLTVSKQPQTGYVDITYAIDSDYMPQETGVAVGSSTLVGSANGKYHNTFSIDLTSRSTGTTWDIDITGETDGGQYLIHLYNGNSHNVTFASNFYQMDRSTLLDASAITVADYAVFVCYSNGTNFYCSSDIN